MFLGARKKMFGEWGVLGICLEKFGIFFLKSELSVELVLVDDVLHDGIRTTAAHCLHEFLRRNFLCLFKH